MKFNKIIITVFMLFVSLFAKAQDAVVIDAESAARYEQDYSIYLLYMFLIATVLGFVYAAYIVIIKRNENKSEESALDKLLYDAVPLDREEEVMTDHDYDGIKELDNHLPPWWVWLLYLTILFAFVYSTYYWWTDFGMTQEQEYENEMLYAKYQKDKIQKVLDAQFDENSVSVVTDAAKLEEGKKIYIENCVLCHAEDGGGKIGPNLTDNFFIHGGTTTEMYAVIKDGVLAKGMRSWKKKFSPFQMQNVMSYIVTELQGTTPAEPKEAQGEEFVK